MKLLKSIFLAVLVCASLAAYTRPALADSHVRFGVTIGGPGYWGGYGPGYWPGYYPYRPHPYPYGYPYPYYPPVVVAPAAPPVYIEQGSPQVLGSAQAPAAAGNWWYYCADSRGYYPYTRECPAGWQRVAPQPPR